MGWAPMRPDTLAEAVRRSIGSAAPLRAHVDEFLDEFYTRPEERQRMIAPVPPWLGDAGRDAWIGAVGEHLARRWNLAIPAWTEDPRRFLARPVFEGGGTREAMMLDLMESPIAFRRRLIFTEAEPLRRARFPRAGAA